MKTKEEIQFKEVIPKLFKVLPKGFYIFLLDRRGDGFFFIKEKRVYSSFKELESATWNIDYSSTYLASIKDEQRFLITFSGKKYTISFEEKNGVSVLRKIQETKLNSTTIIGIDERAQIYKEISSNLLRKAC